MIVVLQYSSAEDRKVPILVTPVWVSEHLNDSNLVIVHVDRLRQGYMKGHIPGARFLWFEYLSPNNPDETIGLPKIDQAKNVLQDIGVSNNSRIVLYGGSKNTVLVTRVYLVLDYLGLASNVSILDGGMDAWKEDGRQLSKEPVVVKRRGKLALKTNAKVIVNSDWVKEHLKDTTICLVDVRSKMQFDGVTGATTRTGHIARAKNIPITSVMDSLARFKNVDDIKKLMINAGVRQDKTAVIYCNIGISASIFYIAAKLLGYDAAVYDGSWEDWGERGEEYPVEVTLPPSPIDTNKTSIK
jgi:thiosulfate/3-mercaptopyruvate sulfurtransferase